METSANNVAKAMGLAPLSASLVLLVYMTLYSAVRSRYDSLLSDWLFISVFAVPIAYIATLLVGLPTHLILSKLGRARVTNYVIVAVFFALLPFLGIYIVDGYFNVHDLLGYPTMVVSCAAAVSWTFATIALSKPRRRVF